MVQNRNINPWAWSTAFGFSRAIETTGHARVLHCAGQTSVDANGELQRAGDKRAQVALAMDNLESVLAAANMTLSNVVRLTIYTTESMRFSRPTDSRWNGSTPLACSRQ